MKTKMITRILQLFALFLFFTSAYSLLSNLVLVKTGSKAMGKVVSSYDEFDYSTQTRGKHYGTTHYIQKPKIEYSIDGETFEVNGKIRGEIGDEYKIGQSVEIYYLADNPRYSTINSFWEFWYEPMRNLILSILVFLFGMSLPQIVDKFRSRFF